MSGPAAGPVVLTTTEELRLFRREFDQFRGRTEDRLGALEEETVDIRETQEELRQDHQRLAVQVEKAIREKTQFRTVLELVAFLALVCILAWLTWKFIHISNSILLLFGPGV